jgi:pimeloyl-ACP methyl ester carboxylesterase
MLTFLAAGTKVWGAALPLFGSSRTLSLSGESVASMVEALKGEVREPANLVAHDVAGLAALLFALEAPERVRSVSVVSSVAAAPTGDSAVNLTLAHPPQPATGREAQRWALERISYSHHHIDEALVEDYVQAAARPKPGDMLGAKATLYEACRTRGFPVPAQVIWGSHDPLGSLEQGLWLFRILAAKQTAVHFHVINRAGALPFREEPQAFHQIVAAFQEGIS